MFRLVHGATLRVRHRPAASAAPHVVFVHALGTGLWAWEGVAERLPYDWGLTLHDLRGHGLSDGAGDTLAAHAADLLALAPEGAFVAGLSIGGQIAMRAALDAPDRFGGLVLADTAPRIGGPGYYDDRIARIRAEGMAPFARDQTARWFAPGFADRDPAAVAGARRALALQDVEGYAAACRAIADTDLSDDLSGLDLPCLCLGGSADVSTTPETIRALAAALPRARARIVDGAGHLPPVEAPDAVADAIRRFVQAPEAVHHAAP